MNRTQMLQRPTQQILIQKFLLFILVAIISVSSYAIPLTNKATISIITIGPYQPELYSAFGHSGIRVYDPDQNIDWMYDYGRFDFDQKNFYSNFARGYMLYSIGRSKDFQRVKEFYKNQDRYIYEQVLNLESEEVQEVFDYLENNYLPENQEYLYNYVYDNCATRIGDVISEALGPKLTFYEGYKEEGKSVRDLMHDYLDYQPWGSLIIDIGLGSDIDREAEASVYRFLPDYVFYSFEKGTINRDSINSDLVGKTNVLHEVKNEPEPVGMFTPFNFFLLLFFVVGFITNRNFKTLKRTKWIDYLLFTVVGLFGWWLVFLWVGTEHISRNNWNLLWAIPFFIPFVYMTENERFRPLLARFFRFAAVLNLLTLVFWAFIPQDLNQALLPLLVTLMLRSFYISYDLGRIRFNK